MKITKESLKRIIKEELEKAVNRRVRIYEKADPSMVDPNLFPSKLSQVDAELAKKLAVSGLEDGSEEDDDAGVAGASVAASELKATQSTMDLAKFVGMSIQMLGKIGGFPNGPGGDLGGIISSDNHIMDGHHRWAGSLLVDPNSKLGGIRINLPGKQLVGVLNVWTAAKKGSEGKNSTHKMSDLTPELVADEFKKSVENADSNKFLPSTEEILAAFKKEGFDSLDAAVEHIKMNWAKTSALRTVESWMPEKKDMPAIEKADLKTVKADIEGGKMDLNPPYGFKKGGESEATNMSSDSEEDKTLNERWMRIAGISNKGRKLI